MSDAILRHCRLALVDACDEGFVPETNDLRSKNLLQFVAHDSDDVLVAQRPDALGISSRKEATQQCPVFWRAMRKLVVHERCSQQLLALAAGNQKSESGRKRLADVATVGQTYSY